MPEGRASHPEGGMSLVEMMVALAIVAVISGISVMSIGASDRGRGAETEARRLSARLGLAVDLALIEGRDVQLNWDDAGYQFSQSTPDLPASPLDGRHDLGPGLRLTGPAGARSLTIREDSAANAAAFIFEGNGPAWRVTFDGFDAPAESMSRP